MRVSHGSVLSAMVTGPSLSRLTVIWAPKLPVRVVMPRDWRGSAERWARARAGIGEARAEVGGGVRRGGPDEAGAPAAGGVGVQRELRDDEPLAADVLD